MANEELVDEIYGYRSYNKLSSSERVRYDQLAKKIDNWIAENPNAKEITKEDMEEFLDLYYISPCDATFVQHCVVYVKNHKDIMCFFK